MRRLTLLLAVVLGLVNSAWGQGSRKDDIVLGPQGRPVGSATVTVCTASATGTPCAPLATLYTDATLTTTSTNPFTSDGLGNYHFYAAPGRYQVQISGAGITTYTLTDVILPNDPTAPAFSSLSASGGITALTLSLGGNLSVTGATNLTGALNGSSATFTGTLNAGTFAPSNINTGSLAVTGSSSTGTLTVTGNSSNQGPRPRVDVTAYGAKGDGVTDDTAAIQAALNAVCGVGPGGGAAAGGVLFFPPTAGASSYYKLTQPASGPVLVIPASCLALAIEGGHGSGGTAGQFSRPPMTSVNVTTGSTTNLSPVLLLGPNQTQGFSIRNISMACKNQCIQLNNFFGLSEWDNDFFSVVNFDASVAPYSPSSTATCSNLNTASASCNDNAPIAIYSSFWNWFSQVAVQAPAQTTFCGAASCTSNVTYTVSRNSSNVVTITATSGSFLNQFGFPVVPGNQIYISDTGAGGSGCVPVGSTTFNGGPYVLTSSTSSQMQFTQAGGGGADSCTVSVHTVISVLKSAIVAANINNQNDIGFLRFDKVTMAGGGVYFDQRVPASGTSGPFEFHTVAEENTSGAPSAMIIFEDQGGATNSVYSDLNMDEGGLFDCLGGSLVMFNETGLSFNGVSIKNSYSGCGAESGFTPVPFVVGSGGAPTELSIAQPLVSGFSMGVDTTGKSIEQITQNFRGFDIATNTTNTNRLETWQAVPGAVVPGTSAKDGLPLRLGSTGNSQWSVGLDPAEGLLFGDGANPGWHSRIKSVGAETFDVGFAQVMPPTGVSCVAGTGGSPGLASGTYYYMISSYLAGSTSTRTASSSEIACAVSGANNKLTISWTQAAGNPGGYYVYRGSSGSGSEAGFFQATGGATVSLVDQGQAFTGGGSPDIFNNTFASYHRFNLAKFGVNNLAPAANLDVIAQDANTVGISVKAAASPAVPPWQVVNSGGVKQDWVDQNFVHNMAQAVIGSGSPINKYQLLSAAITPASVAANTCAEQTFTPGAFSTLAASDNIYLNFTSADTTLTTIKAWRAVSGGVAITYCNFTGSAITPSSVTVNVTAWR